MKADKEKQKMMIVAVLAVVVVGVGAFQMLGGPGAPLPGVTKKAGTTAANTPPPGPKNPNFANVLVERDPFASKLDDETAKPPTPPANNAPKPLRGRRLRGDLGGNVPTLPAPTGNIGIAPVSPPAPVFGYRLSGVIVGNHPAAVFTDANGAQRLVPAGGSLDGDARLVSVKPGEATVSFQGKRLHLSLGGIPDAH